MLIMYGAPICSNCVQAKADLEARGIPFEYRDITSSTRILRDFLKLRDTDPAYATVKEEGRIGIPTFLREDGSLVIGEDALPELKACEFC